MTLSHEAYVTDQICQMVIRTFQSALAVAELAKVYHDISGDHILEPLRCLSRIYNLKSGPQLEYKNKELLESCSAAIAAIDKATQEHRRGVQERIRQRLGEVQHAVQQLSQPQHGLNQIIHRACGSRRRLQRTFSANAGS